MALINRRTGIAGITLGALLCLICGIPFIAALLGLGGLSLSAILSDLPTKLTYSIIIGSLIVLLLPIAILIRRRSRPTTEIGK